MRKLFRMQDYWRLHEAQVAALTARVAVHLKAEDIHDATHVGDIVAGVLVIAPELPGVVAVHTAAGQHALADDAVKIALDRLRDSDPLVFDRVTKDQYVRAMCAIGWSHATAKAAASRNGEQELRRESYGARLRLAGKELPAPSPDPERKGNLVAGTPHSIAEVDHHLADQDRGIPALGGNRVAG
jgi:hypothetical protein